MARSGDRHLHSPQGVRNSHQIHLPRLLTDYRRGVRSVRFPHRSHSDRHPQPILPAHTDSHNSMAVPCGTEIPHASVAFRHDSQYGHVDCTHSIIHCLRNGLYALGCTADYMVADDADVHSDHCLHKEMAVGIPRKARYHEPARDQGMVVPAYIFCAYTVAVGILFHHSHILGSVSFQPQRHHLEDILDLLHRH